MAAALLATVLVPLVAFSSYLALTDASALYGEAVRLAESYAESGDAGAEGEAGVDAAYLTLTPSAVFAHGRLTATRTVAREGMVTTLTVTVRRTRTGRVITALERSFFDPVPLEDEALP